MCTRASCADRFDRGSTRRAKMVSASPKVNPAASSNAALLVKRFHSMKRANTTTPSIMTPERHIKEILERVKAEIRGTARSKSADL